MTEPQPFAQSEQPQFAQPQQYRQALPPPPPPRRLGLFIVGIVLGVAVGAGGVALGWSVSGSGGGKTNASGSGQATADENAACESIRGLDASGNTRMDATTAYTWSGAAQLAMAAGDLDSRYKQLSDEMHRVLEGVLTLDLNSPEVSLAAQQAQNFCATH